jgi:hypothetical protein
MNHNFFDRLTQAKNLLKSWKQLVSSSPRAAAQPKQADTTSTAPEVKAPETKSSEGAVVIPPLEPGADVLRSKVRQKLGDVIKNAAVGAHVEVGATDILYPCALSLVRWSLISTPITRQKCCGCFPLRMTSCSELTDPWARVSQKR